MKKRIRRLARDACYWASDKLCFMGIRGAATSGGMYEIYPRRGRYRLTFLAGHWLGEIGERLK